jgi:hypothetical protein
MSEKKKQKYDWHELVVVTFLVILTSAVTFGITWLALGLPIKENQEVSDAVRAGLQARIVQLEKKLKTGLSESETSELNKTYQGTGYAISYPATWVYRVYNDSASALVVFAPTESGLPAANSDQMPVISASIVTKAATAEELTSETKYASHQTATIGTGITATVWTLAAGRPNDLNGDQKIVIYEVKLANGQYLRLENTNDQNKDVFAKILASLRL